MDLNMCQSALATFAGKRVLVIGDLMLDEHIWGTAERISPEAPVMVVNVDSREGRAGGAANVANNIRALGAQATVVGLIGDDEGGAMLRACLEGSGIDTGGLIIDKHRMTTRKTRIWASHRQQVVRVDHESRKKASAGAVKRITDYIESVAADHDALLISDYDKGVVTREVAVAAIKAAQRAGKVSASNPKPRNMHYFAGIDVIQLNQAETMSASGLDISERADVEKAARKLLGSIGCGSIVITRGPRGLAVCDQSSGLVHVPAVVSEVYDSVGAGDTVISMLTLGLASGLGVRESAVIGNCAAGVVVRKVGVTTTTLDEISSMLVSSWSQFASL